MMRFKKVYGMIPEDLFLRLQEANLLKDSWDEWFALAIERKLDEEGL
jgi:hypothetical protein